MSRNLRLCALILMICALPTVTASVAIAAGDPGGGPAGNARGHGGAGLARRGPGRSFAALRAIA